MYTVRAEADFAAAHFLSHYHGKCERLHGHNYRVRLWVKGEKLDDGGMLADFGVLKDVLRKICAGLDHRNLNDLPELGQPFAGDPSAERIACYIFAEAEKEFAAVSLDPLLVHGVDVYETQGNMARYERTRRVQDSFTDSGIKTILNYG